MNNGFRPERRRSTRYEISLNLRYMTHGHRTLIGKGQTLNISASGLLFRSDAPPHRGELVEAAIEWPFTSPQGHPLRLMVGGYVLRGRASLAAVSIVKREIVPVFEVGHWTSGEKKRYEPIRPILVVLQENRPYNMIVSALSGWRYPTYRTDAAGAREILTSGFPAARMIITDDLESLGGISIRIPVIYYGELDEGPAGPGASKVARLLNNRKPLSPEDIRAAVASALIPELFQTNRLG